MSSASVAPTLTATCSRNSESSGETLIAFKFQLKKKKKFQEFGEHFRQNVGELL